MKRGNPHSSARLAASVDRLLVTPGKGERGVGCHSATSLHGTTAVYRADHGGEVLWLFA
jgi:hypothetical protein